MYSLRSLVAAGLLSASFAFAQVAPPAEKAPVAPTLNVSARLVTVPVTVRDKKGQLVATLKQEDFTIAEDGKPQVIRYFDRDNNLQLTLGLLVDVSGSQRQVLDEEREASSSFLDNMLVADRDKAFLIQFGHTVELLTDVTGSIPKLQSGLKQVDTQAARPQFSNNQDPNDNSGGSSQRGRRGGGGGAGTALYDAIFLASDEVIHKQPFRKALILLTDGEDNGSKESLSSAIEAAQRADTAVYSIYFKGEEHNDTSSRRPSFGGGGFPGGGGRHGGGGGQGGGQPQRTHVDGKKILQRISDETGGRFFEVSKKEPLAEIYKNRTGTAQPVPHRIYADEPGRGISQAPGRHPQGPQTRPADARRVLHRFGE